MGSPFTPDTRACKSALFEILVVEDHPMMIRSIKAGLAALHTHAHAVDCIATVSSLMQAKQRLRRSEPPGLIITDLHLPDSKGLDTLRALRDAVPGTPIVVFSACDDHATERAALALGAHAFVSKSALPQNFTQAIKPFLLPLKKGRTTALVSPPGAPHPIAQLTRRQRDVLAEAASGYRDREIGLRLKIGAHTVRSHLRVIFLRLGVQNRTQASSVYIAWARANGTLV
ncbi:MAG: response regulator transcription factor [Hydrogenophaga sp.]|jgi:two-component system nitrate/nitrite response regulator NarL|uniref:response regulator transcription factor n=1 Tax=Hydrogenophaga sp. TaxID=1904254 RepID=UPI002615B28D|nr:response regulator transcription factor [Hydrogenophaga sp.]MCW5670575.1 response regulator transcription factor [Hydrogenophaga sp.]